MSLGGAKVIFEVRLTKNVHCDLDQEKCILSNAPTHKVCFDRSNVDLLEQSEGEIAWTKRHE